MNPDPAIFVSDLQDVNEKLLFFLTFKTSTKNLFFLKVFCLLLFEGTFLSFFKDKKS
jgi:hypothetical protein